MKKLLILCLVSFSSFCSLENKPLEISAGTVRALIPGQTTTVAYARLRNNTAQPIVLVSATAENVGAIEFHTHLRDGNQVKMRRLPNLLIPANDSLILTTGAHHLMLFRVSELNDQLDIQFTSQSGETYKSTFTLVAL